MNNKINPQPPKDFTGLKLDLPASEAAGMKAITSSVKHVFGQMSINRGLKALFNLNQKGGIDCPSCAWPDPEHRSSLGEYCENGAKAIAEEATTRKLGTVFFQKYSVEELSKKSDYWLSQQGRLTHPMILREGKNHYEKITWNESFKILAKHLNNLQSPDEAIFYTSGRTSNEAAFLYQLFVRKFGTNNLPDCSNMCHESSGTALGETLGLGKGSVTLEDFEKAEIIMILGQNPGTNHPRMLSALEKAKQTGAKIISINPLIEAGLLAFKHPQNLKDMIFGSKKLTDIYLQIRINGDLALLKAFNKILIEAECENHGQVLDSEFIIKNTEGFELLKKDLEKYNFGQLSDACGIEYEKIKEAANLLIHHQKIIVCWAMGLTQHKNSVVTIQEIVNLLLLKGSIGKEGAGTCPVRGHSNVQGDRTMGIFERPKPEFLDKLKENFGFEPPRKHGFDTVEAIKAMAENRTKVFFALGGNFLSATPDTEFTAKALQSCELTAHVSTKLNRSHLIHGKTALILPCLGRTDKDLQANGEQFVSVENSMGVVHSSKGVLEPPSKDLLSEVAIIANLAHFVFEDSEIRRLENLKIRGFEESEIQNPDKNNRQPIGHSIAQPQTHTINWLNLAENYDKIRDLIEKTIDGFENYNQKVRQEGGFYLPNAPRQQQFSTDTKKAKFSVNPLEIISLEKDEFLMMTIRSHDQFNTTIYGLDDRYRGIFNERRIILMNETDMKESNFKQYEVVNLHNFHGGIERIAERFIVVPYSIPRKNVATYFPEANVLVPIDSFADKSKTPTSKSVVIRIRKL